MAKSSKGKDVGKQTPPSPARSAASAGPPAPALATASAAPGRPARPRDVRQARMSQTFSQVVAVLMRDRNFKNLKLSDLEWLVIPPILSGQWKLGQARAPTKPGNSGTDGGALVPVAVALWASVSPAIDKRLSESLDKPIMLKPAEWASGPHIWLLVAAGDPVAVPKFLKQLSETEFKGKLVKLRLQGPDGKAVVRALGKAS